MKIVQLLYRNPDTGKEVSLSVPVPIEPKLLALLERSLTAEGFVRVEEPEE